MAVYMIRRPFPGATQETLDAAGYRSEACIPFYPGMTWLSTYWDPKGEETICFYEARNAEDIRRHADQAHLPCGEIRPVDVLRDSAGSQTTVTPLAG